MDALAVFNFGRRHSGIHEKALSAVKGALSKDELDDVEKQFGGLMALKNRAEYQKDRARDLMSKQDMPDY